MNKPFKNVGELFEALVGNHKIRHNNWAADRYIYLVHGQIVGPQGSEVSFRFDDPTNWYIYEPEKTKRTIILHEYVWVDFFVGHINRLQWFEENVLRDSHWKPTGQTRTLEIEE